MKKKGARIAYYIVCLIIIITSVFVIDYSVAKMSGSGPLFAIKKYDDKEQYYEYSGVFYKMWICSAEEKNYKVGKYSDVPPICPKLIKFNEDGSYTNINNLKITKEEYALIKNYYFYETINNWTKISEIEEAVSLSREVDEKNFTTKEGYYTEYNGTNYMIAIFDEFKELNGEYAWRKGINNIDYHYCVKYNEDKTKYLFSKYNGSTCDGNFKELKFSNKWCDTVREKETNDYFKTLYNEKCE